MSVEIITPNEPEPIISNKQLIENIKSFHCLELKKRSGEKISSQMVDGYSEQDEYKKYLQALPRGHNFIACKVDGDYFFTPSKFVGYYRRKGDSDFLPNTIGGHFIIANDKNGLRGGGGQTDEAIIKLLGEPRMQENLQQEYEDFCRKVGINLSKKKNNKQKKFWNLQENILSIGINSNKDNLTNRSTENKLVEDECLTEDDKACLGIVLDTVPVEAPALKEALIKIRVGQAKYRKRLEKIWGEKCSVSGISAREVLRASHIKPHSRCNSGEHNDVNNGLLLRADLDALFDKGLITFSDEGNMKISLSLEPADREKLNFHLPHKLRKPLNSKQKEYLAWHFVNIFQK